jgi:hypothetical protein
MVIDLFRKAAEDRTDTGITIRGERKRLNRVRWRLITQRTIMRHQQHEYSGMADSVEISAVKPDPDAAPDGFYMTIRQPKHKEFAEVLRGLGIDEPPPPYAVPVAPSAPSAANGDYVAAAASPGSLDAVSAALAQLTHKE